MPKLPQDFAGGWDGRPQAALGRGVSGEIRPGAESRIRNFSPGRSAEEESGISTRRGVRRRNPGSGTSTRCAVRKRNPEFRPGARCGKGTEHVEGIRNSERKKAGATSCEARPSYSLNLLFCSGFSGILDSSSALPPSRSSRSGIPLPHRAPGRSSASRIPLPHRAPGRSSGSGFLFRLAKRPPYRISTTLIRSPSLRRTTSVAPPWSFLI